MKETVLITGGTGLVGKTLSKLLISKGCQVSVLTRNNKKSTEHISYYKWNIEKQEMDERAVLEADAIVHLVGENVASGRWNSKRKASILSSRVKATELIYKVLAKHKNKVNSFVSASATGYYGTVTSEKILKEEDGVGSDFLASICSQWENSIDRFSSLGVRVVKMRTGVVLGRKKSALQKMLPPFTLGLGAAIGNGKQYMPWIHIDDLCKMYLLALKNVKMKGAYNAAVGDNLTNKELSKAISFQLKKPFFMPNIPAFLLHLIFGEMAIILTNGTRVSSEKIKATGFVFEYSKIEDALENLLD